MHVHFHHRMNNASAMLDKTSTIAELRGPQRGIGVQKGIATFSLLLVAWLAPYATARAGNAYVINSVSDDVSVIDTTSNTVLATIPVGDYPTAAAISPDGRMVYVTNLHARTVSVIATATNTVIGSITVCGTSGSPDTGPTGVGITPDGSKVYIACRNGNFVEVIDAATNTSTLPITVGLHPIFIGITPDGSKAYVTNFDGNTVSVINVATDTLIKTISIGIWPSGVTISPDGTKAYIVNHNTSDFYVIDTATDNVIAGPVQVCSPDGGAGAMTITPDGDKGYVNCFWEGSIRAINLTTSILIGSAIPVGGRAGGAALSLDGSMLYAPSADNNAVAVIDTDNDTITGSPITAGNEPIFVVIQPEIPPEFTGTPGARNCYGRSISALAKEFGGVPNAAKVRGFDSVAALGDAIKMFCKP